MDGMALYIHVPFCVKKCAYCDFTSFPGRERDMAPYFARVCEDMRAQAERLGRARVSSIYIGGGTPTLAGAEAVDKVVRCAREYFDVAEDAEISMEANPGALDEGELSAYRTAGINRLSIGVQSLSDDMLRKIGRIHTSGQAVEAISRAREAGFENINIDLIYALPGQSIDTWRDTLKRSVDLAPDHISCYSLIVEPNTPLYHEVESGIVNLPDEDIIISMQLLSANELLAAGYERYEISNFALPGRECRHNLVYWTRGEYLGLGCAAHSLIEGTRIQNTDSLDEYLSGKSELAREVMSIGDVREEKIMLELRMSRGLDLALFARDCGEDLAVSRASEIESLISGGFLELDDGFLRATVRGMDVLNAVILRLV